MTHRTLAPQEILRRRERIATACLAGMLAAPSADEYGEGIDEADALAYADALIAALDAEATEPGGNYSNSSSSSTAPVVTLPEADLTASDSVSAVERAALALEMRAVGTISHGPGETIRDRVWREAAAIVRTFDQPAEQEAITAAGTAEPSVPVSRLREVLGQSSPLSVGVRALIAEAEGLE